MAQRSFLSKTNRNIISMTLSSVADPLPFPLPLYSLWRHTHPRQVRTTVGWALRHWLRVHASLRRKLLIMM